MVSEGSANDLVHGFKAEMTWRKGSVVEGFSTDGTQEVKRREEPERIKPFKDIPLVVWPL